MRKLFCLLGLCLVAACSKHAGRSIPSMPSTPKLLVVTTIAPMYCFTKNVAGDLADVEMIVPPGVPARGFEPTARQQQEILRADLVVENGFGFEPWIDKLVTQGLKPGATRVIAARGTGPGIPGLPGDPNTPPGDSPPDVSEPPDPHVWLDPLMAIKEVQNIRDALMARDPVHADEFLANENRYEATLRDLEDEVGRMTVAIPKRRLLCVDKTFTYFLSHFEFPTAKPGDEADAVLELVNTDPKGWHLKGSRFVKADPMECGPASTDFYERVMRANAEALREGLAQ